jgi:hypothetical protein
VQAKTAHDCCYFRSEYIALLLQEKAASASKSSSEQKGKQPTIVPPLSSAQKKDKLDIEMLLPLCALIEFHQLASTQHYTQRRLERAEQEVAVAAATGGTVAKKSGEKSSWFGSWWGGSDGGESKSKNKNKNKNKSTTEADVASSSTSSPLHDEESDMVVVEAPPRPVTSPAAASYALDLSVDSNAATISLTSASRPVATMAIACTSHVTYCPDGDVSCSLSMTCLTVKDEVTRQPVVQHLVSVAAHAAPYLSHAHDKERRGEDFQTPPKQENPFPLAVSYTSHPAKKQSSLTVTSLPLIFCWNPLCVSQLLDLVTVLPYHENLSAEKQSALSRRAAILLRYQSYRNDTLARRKKQEAVRQAQAPQFGALQSTGIR